jgi:hypothetical protein
MLKHPLSESWDKYNEFLSKWKSNGKKWMTGKGPGTFIHPALLYNKTFGNSSMIYII